MRITGLLACSSLKLRKLPKEVEEVTMNLFQDLGLATHSSLSYMYGPVHMDLVWNLALQPSPIKMLYYFDKPFGKLLLCEPGSSKRIGATTKMLC